MHTVVFGWFGASAVWFIPLLWRIVKSVLPNGGGLRGPGTIRLWLGFFCVLLASCTLEAALFHSFAFAANVDHLGHALLTGLGGHAGVISTTGALSVGAGAAAVFLISLPWLCGFKWRETLSWANGAFGLGLKPEWFAARERTVREKPSRGRASRDKAETRGASAGLGGFRTSGTSGVTPSGRTSHEAPALGLPTATQRQGGRYQRPTVWRPQPARRSEAERPMRGPEAARPIEPVSANNLEPGSGKDSYSDRFPDARPAALHNGRGVGAREPLEPVAPAGWLKTGASSGTREQAAGGNAPAAGLTGAANAAGTAPSNSTRTAATRGTDRSADAGTSRRPEVSRSSLNGSAPGAVRASGSSGVSQVSQAASRTTSITPARGVSSPPIVSSESFFAATASSAAVPTKPAGAPPAPERIKETLRSIEQNAAQWTTRAGDIDAARDAGAEPDSDDANSERDAAPLDASSASEDAAISPATETLATSSAPIVAPSANQPGQPGLTEGVAPMAASSVAGTYSSSASLRDGYTFTTGAQTIGREPTPLDKSTNTNEADIRDNAALPHPAAPDTTATNAPSSPPTPTPTSTPAHPSDLPQWAIRAAQTHAVQTTRDNAPTAPSSPISESSATSPVNPVQTPPWQDGASAARPPVPPFSVIDTNATPNGTTPNGTDINANGEGPLTPIAAIPNGYAAQVPIDQSVEREPETEAQQDPTDDHPSNVVHFPRAAAVPETLAPDASLLQPDPRPPVRGFIATEFEFHAPAASAVDLPGLDLLEPASDEVEPVSEQHLAETGQLIEQRLQEFKVPVTVVGASAGPVITRFEVEPALGVRGSQIVGLMKDLSRGLGLTSIRVVETIPGKTCMGLELPNAKRQMIRLSEILEADVYRDSKSFLTIAMGKDIVGNPVVTDLARAPHMLVAGTTGSGKSVAINAMILSLLYKAKPEDVRLIMIDPKMLELSVYEGIPHLLAPVVTDMKLAANALNWCVGEMEKRYKLMSAVGVRNLQGFNQKVRNADAAGKKLTNPFSLTPDAPEPLAKLPMIVVVIDELADLMMVAGKQIEQLIARLAQKARAAGIHLILATQRPSVDVITGLIKANIPTRVAFQVSSKIDSRTILDQMGAESLLGAGDMLFLPPGTGYPQRVHGAFVADEEVHSVVEYLKQFGEPEYEEGILSGPTPEGGTPDLFGETPDAEADPLYDEAVSFVLRTRRASISSVQRQLRIGYNRAARLVEQMETAGLVSPMGTNGNREVLAPGPAE
ncbi:cell division protein FtsK [Caballeronia sp. SEWSISQ10-4 2]|uniref:FtsK/SpoIIIE family DNA translocase n=1 Tax=Caballeronia sp. SEWSISQ10-4 2 TaxID=2937438 RepID=UPI00264FD48F|nr:DNA translocase FtsK [Caballeronia sp. SEWSISQ10-4 2]MDN7176534.1 cell division protein FtsK [Caballeronia sp. SEWSISQ10-4 2]